MLILRLAFRNARRNVHRTLLTAGTVVLGTALLTVALAWIDGVFGSMTDTMTELGGHVRVVTPGYAEREQLLPLTEHVPDAAALVAAAQRVEGVRGVYPRVTTGVTLTKGEQIGDHFAPVTGAPLAWYAEQLHLADDIVAGTTFTGAEGELVLGATIAGQLGAVPGDTVLLLGQTQDGAMAPVKGKLVGIVSAGNALVDAAAMLPLEPVQWMADIGGGATEVLVYGDGEDSGRTLAAALRADPAFAGLTVQAWDEQPRSEGLVSIIGVVRGIISAIIVFVCALAVWNTMMMSVLERTKEIGVLRAMGMSSLGTVGLFVLEGLMIAALGGVLGVLLGGALGGWLEVTGIDVGSKITSNAGMPIPSRLYADMNATVAVTGFLLGLATAVFGTAVPAIRASMVSPVTAMQSR